MEVTHAFWEKRNLNVDSYKITIEENDTIDDLIAAENNNPCDYLLVRVPVTKKDIFVNMGKLGYDFIEAQAYCHFDIGKKYELTPIQQRLMDSVRCEIMDSSDICEMDRNIAEGLFEYDTIATDPHFSLELANKRFIGLIHDSMGKGYVVYKIVYRDKNIGFFSIAHKGDNVYDALIGGIYKEYQRVGFGSIMNYLEIQTVSRLGAKKLLSAFSTNNHGAHAVHMSMGYTLDKINYIFAKHK